MLQTTLFTLLSIVLTAAPQARGGAVEKEKTRFATQKAIDFAGQIVPPGKYILSLVDDELFFSQEHNMITVSKLPISAEPNKDYFYMPEVKVELAADTVTITYFSQDKKYTISGQRLDNYVPPQKGQVAQVKKVDEKVAAPSAHDNYAHDLAVALKKLEKQVEHCEDVAIRRKATKFDDKLTLCICPIAQKWKLPPPKTLYRKDKHFRKKTHGYSLIINQQGKVIDCAVWAKKPDFNPFHESYQAAGDGQKKAPITNEVPPYNSKAPKGPAPVPPKPDAKR